MNKPDIDAKLLKIESLWMKAENRVIQDIARRIKKTGEITSTADYQLNRLMDVGRSSEELEKIILDTTKKTMPEVWELYDDICNWQYVRCRDIYEQINDHKIPKEENLWMQQVNDAIKQQTKGAIENLSGSFGYAVDMNGKKVFMPFAQYYQTYVDDAMMDVISGNMDYGSVVKKTIKQMTDSGLRSVDYASGHSNRTPVAIRRAVLTGVNQMTAKINEHNATLLNTNMFEVDAHAGARPTHAEWQGRVYSHDDLVRVCGLGDVAGLCGANCSHQYYPFVEGVSVRAYSNEDLEKMADPTEYEVNQNMRKMETSMRAQRELIRAMQKAGASKDDVTDAKMKYRGQLHQYSVYCSSKGKNEQRERIYMDGLGRVV